MSAIPKLVPIFRDSLEAAIRQIRCYRIIGGVMMKRRMLVLFFATLIKSDIITRQEFALY